MNHGRIKKYFLVFALILAITASGQNILVLQKASGGGIRMYRENEYISLRTAAKNLKIEGRIVLIEDSCLIIDSRASVLVDDIAAIYRTRRMFSLLQKVSLIGGGMYLAISTLNGVINNDSPIVDNKTLKISGGLIAAGIILTPLTERRHRIAPSRWKVKILDFTD